MAARRRWLGGLPCFANERALCTRSVFEPSRNTGFNVLERSPSRQWASFAATESTTTTHMNKGGGSNALYRFQDSLATVAAARFGYLVAPHPEDPETRVLACVKTNLAKMPPSLSFRIDTMFHEGAQGDIGFVTWLGSLEMTSTDLLGGDTRASAGAVARAETFLQQTLTAGAMKSEDVLAAASKKGIGKNSVWEAKKALGVKARRQGYGNDGEWQWELPDVGH